MILQGDQPGASLQESIRKLKLVQGTCVLLELLGSILLNVVDIVDQ